MPELRGELRSAEDHPEFEKLNTLVQSLVGTIRTKQDEYFAVRKQYFQGLEIPAVECDGLVECKIDERLKPHDQQEAWKDFDDTVFHKNATLPFKIRIDVYKTPHKGWGWVLTAKYKYLDETWMYQHDEGPGGLLEGPPDEWFLNG